MRTSYSHDDAGRLTRLVNLSPAAATLSSFDYRLDAVGNRTRVAESNGDRVTWSYDDTYQLTAERRSGANAYAVTYSYDASGNRLVKRDSGARTIYAYGARE